MTLAIIGGKGHVCGPCPTCGAMFRSRYRGKVYCALACYLSSTQFREMRAANVQKAQARATMPATHPCKNCGVEMPRRRRRKYCSKQCRREWFAARFDRWIASPESIALPQNYDEFLARDELSCPVAGCEWRGKHLSSHVNFCHGVTARDFKKLVGFNLTTGLVDIETSRRMSRRRQQAECPSPPTGLVAEVRAAIKNRQPRYLSLEGREHRAKAMAEADVMGKLFAGRDEKREQIRAKASETQKRNHALGVYNRVSLCSVCGKSNYRRVAGLTMCRTCSRAARLKRGKEEPWSSTCPVCGMLFTGTRNIVRNQRKRHYDLSENCKLGVQQRRPHHLREQ